MLAGQAQGVAQHSQQLGRGAGLQDSVNRAAEADLRSRRQVAAQVQDFLPESAALRPVIEPPDSVPQHVEHVVEVVDG